MRNISSLHVSLIVSSVDSAAGSWSPVIAAHSASVSEPSGTGVTVNLAMVVGLRLSLPPRGTAVPVGTGTVDSSPRATVWAVYSSCWANWPLRAIVPYSAASVCAAEAVEVGETEASVAGKVVAVGEWAKTACSNAVSPTAKEKDIC